MTEKMQAAAREASPEPTQTQQMIQALSIISQSLNHIATGIERNHALLKHVLMTQSAYLGDGTALTYDDQFWKIFVDTRAHDLGPHLLLGSNWEDQYRALFEKLVMPGDVVFDVGANIGVYTFCAARRTGRAGRIHAFEPNPRLAGLLSKSVAVNGCRDFVQVHALALSHQNGEAQLHLDEAESGSASLCPQGLSKEKDSFLRCQTRRADELFGPECQVDVMKMDVEGFEGCVLQGMRDILTRSQDVRIMLEWYPPMLDAAPVNASQTVAFLRELGFSAWEVAAADTLTDTSWEDLLKPDQVLRNIVVARTRPLW